MLPPAAIRRWRTCAVVFALALLTTLLAPWFAAPATAGPLTASSTARAQDAGPVVLIGTAGLRWDDVTPEGTPHLWQLLQEGAVADLAIRNIRTAACPVDGWLAVSSGRRAGDVLRDVNGPRCRTAEQPARRGSSAVVQRWDVYTENAVTGTFGAQPGMLGEALRRNDLRVTAIGPGAAIATADEDGAIVGSYQHRPRSPAELGRVVGAALDESDLLVVDIGNLRDRDELAETDVDRVSGSRADQAARLDASIGAVLDEVDDGTTVLVASLADSGGTPHLQLLAATGPGPPAGRDYEQALLGAQSTRQDGMAQVTDVMPTLLALLDVPAPDGLPGAVVLPQPGSPADAQGRRRKLIDLAEAAITVQPLVVWFFNGLVIAQILLYGGAALALRNNWGGLEGRRRVLGILRRVAVVFACVPVSTFLANLVPWWRASNDLLAVVGAVLVGVMLISTLALAGPWRNRRLGPLGFVSGVTAGVLALDVATGSHLQISSLMGQQPLVAGRFYGLGNVQFALFATGALLLAVAIADSALRSGRRNLAVATVVVIGLGAVIIDGTPGIGSDFGGPPAMIPAFALLSLLVAGIRITWRRLVLIGAGTLAVVIMLSVTDWLRPPSERTHFGRFVQTVMDGGAMTVIERKALQNLEILTGSWLTVLVPFGAVFIGLILMRPVAWGAPALQRTYEASPTLRHGLVALLIMLTIGFAVNDSGTVVPAIGATLVIPLLIAASVRTLELADAEERRRSAVPSLS